MIPDYLRVWRAGEPETRLECLLNNNKNSDFCAPLTSFDWNEVDPNLLGTSSIDTTCTIWYFDYFLTFLSLIGEGSGCSTVVEHRPTEQNSLGYELIPSGCWAFFCSFYPSVLHPESGSSWRCNTTYCLSQKNRCVQLDMHRFGKKNISYAHLHCNLSLQPFTAAEHKACNQDVLGSNPAGCWSFSSSFCIFLLSFNTSESL